MLEIIIAILLIYALFASLVSGINEMIVQIFAMRGRILFEGIVMMLGELPKERPFNQIALRAPINRYVITTGWFATFLYISFDFFHGTCAGADQRWFVYDAQSKTG